MRDKN